MNALCSPELGTRMWIRSTTSVLKGARILPRIPAHYRRRRGDSARSTILFLSICLLLAVCLFACVARGAGPAMPNARNANERFRHGKSYQSIVHTIVQLFRFGASVFL